MSVTVLEPVAICGSMPFINIQTSKIIHKRNMLISEKSIKNISILSLNEMKQMDTFVKYVVEIMHFILISFNKMLVMIDKTIRQVKDWRVNKDRWVIHRSPTDSFYQHTSADELRFFSSLNAQWIFRKMRNLIETLMKRVEKKR